MSYLSRVNEELERIREAGQYRTVEREAPAYAADFSTNDYLGLAADSRMVEAMRHVKRVGAGGARLLGGRHHEHRLLEDDLAQWLGRERALLFSSGYMAALGAIHVLARCVGSIYSDERNHASIVDGVRSTKLPRTVYAHGVLQAARDRSSPALVVTESLFGMDGDSIDPRAVLAELGESDVLLIDEAHALGVFGPHGAGLAHGLNDDRVVILGTLGKAVGASGGFIAGPERTIDLLVNAARTFIFDTALPPALAFAARVGVLLARNGDDRRDRLFARAARLRDGLGSLGVPVRQERSPIVSIVLGDEARALDAMRRCLERGVYAPAIRPPTVPAGTSRLRASVRADHTDAQIDMLLESLDCIVTS